MEEKTQEQIEQQIFELKTEFMLAALSGSALVNNGKTPVELAQRAEKIADAAINCIFEEVPDDGEQS
jgi:hypothetical protein